MSAVRRMRDRAGRQPATTEQNVISPSDWLVRLRPRWQTNYVGQSRTIIATDANGWISPVRGQGLFVHETRLLSRYQYFIDDQMLLPIALSNVEQHTWLGYYIMLPPGFPPGLQDGGSGQVADGSQNALELRLARYVSNGVHEDVELTNFTQHPTSKFRLHLRIDADFAAIDETLSGRREQHGKKTCVWEAQSGALGALSYRYSARHQYANQSERGVATFRSGIDIVIVRAGSQPRWRSGTLSFEIQLQARASWHACIHWIPIVEGDRLEPRHVACSFIPRSDISDRLRQQFIRHATKFSTSEKGRMSHVVSRTLDQARRDLAALRLHDMDQNEHAWTVAAGLPTYLALFGRDTLSVAWQSSLLTTELLRGTLPLIAKWQGTKIDDWRDEQPGKMLHEAHTDPLSLLNFNPRQRYYGATSTSPFFSVALSLLWHWTGDTSLVEPLLGPAINAIRWIDRYGDSNGDGFYDYKCRSQKGNRNQGWKDSGDAIVYEDGSQVQPPIGTCEEQAYVYAAKLHLSGLLWWLNRKDEAKRLYHEAGELKKRFNEAFWVKEKSSVAMGLDSHSKQITSIGSDPGHCIATGILDGSLVQPVADRLLSDELFSGWGVRTLSARHPAYNPYSYHRGSVWPVENAAFALGFTRYGLLDQMHHLCLAQFEAAALFDYCRLPEVLSGHTRDPQHPFPALYPDANWPQAWSASSVFLLVEAMLGLYPYAPPRLLIIDPQLPAWLPEITLENIRVADAVLKIRFYRKSDGKSDYEILDQKGRLFVIRQPSPWSLRVNYAERVRDVLASFVRAT
jgi:glycogen debranching enzyme